MAMKKKNGVYIAYYDVEEFVEADKS